MKLKAPLINELSSSDKHVYSSLVALGRMECESRSSSRSNEPTATVSSVNTTESEKQIVERSIDCIYNQISWANNCLTYPDTHLEQRNQLVTFIRNCYETVESLKKHK